MALYGTCVVERARYHNRGKDRVNKAGSVIHRNTPIYEKFLSKMALPQSIKQDCVTMEVTGASLHPLRLHWLKVV